jgi:hypothetical protein
MQRNASTYSTGDLSLAAYLCAQGATVRSIHGRTFFLEVPGNLDASKCALGFINSPDAAYDQIVRLVKKVVFDGDSHCLVGTEGQWSIEGQMEVAAYLCFRGATIVGFQRLSRRGRSYRIHFDSDASWCDGVVAEWPNSSAKRFDDEVMRLKRIGRS